mgnify:CR=1 FL=1
MRWILKLLVLVVTFMLPQSAIAVIDVVRGEYIFRAAGCGNCHTDPGAKGNEARPKGEKLAGGRPLKTPFGTFYTPNITPHQEAGIGSWSFEEFRGAMVLGVAPNSAPYYPAFPYTSYTGMPENDLADLWAYIKLQKPSARANREHDLEFPFNVRALMHGWRLLFFAEGRNSVANPSQSRLWNRGAYLVRVLAHCGECHTPRNTFGAMDMRRELAGNPKGPSGKVPGLAPSNAQGIVGWSRSDLVEYISSGMTPEGDFAGGEMAEVIDHSTAMMSIGDREAIAEFLKTLK